MLGYKGAITYIIGSKDVDEAAASRRSRLGRNAIPHRVHIVRRSACWAAIDQV